jgi:hypothetical protein
MPPVTIPYQTMPRALVRSDQLNTSKRRTRDLLKTVASATPRRGTSTFLGQALVEACSPLSIDARVDSFLSNLIYFIAGSRSALEPCLAALNGNHGWTFHS